MQKMMKSLGVMGKGKKGKNNKQLMDRMAKMGPGPGGMPGQSPMTGAPKPPPGFLNRFGGGDQK